MWFVVPESIIQGREVENKQMDAIPALARVALDEEV